MHSCSVYTHSLIAATMASATHYLLLKVLDVRHVCVLIALWLPCHNH